VAHRKTSIARRDFLTAIGKAVGGSAMLRTMAAMGIATAMPGCSSSSAGSGSTPPVVPAPRLPQASPRPGDWPGNAGVGKSVVILGAGIAGMR
jgi:hypothetical protein